MAEIVQLTPLFFGPGGAIGGGERYPLELARAIAEHLPTRLVTFGAEPRRLRAGHLRIHILPTRGHYAGSEVNPVSPWFPFELVDPHIIHAHQYESIVTNAAITSALAGKRVFVTEHGGRGRNYARKFRLHRLVAQNLPVSQYSADDYPQFRAKTTVIYGGVDTERFSVGAESGRTRQALFVGRLIPMKGVDRLIEALPEEVPLDVIGPRYNPQYWDVLQRLATGKRVNFRDPPQQDELVSAYQRARVFVLPSTYTSEHGPRERAELFPLVLLEAMACGTPVICTRVGGMPELVDDGVNGFVVEPGDTSTLRDRIREVISDDALWRQLSSNAATTIREKYTWPLVAERCLKAYGL